MPRLVFAFALLVLVTGCGQSLRHSTAPTIPHAPQPSAAAPISARARQPCELATTTLDAKAEKNCYEVPELMVNGHPAAVCVKADAPRVYAYDAQGRVVSDSVGQQWTWNADGTGRTTNAGGFATTLRLDRQVRIVAIDEVTFAWDEFGRLVRTKDGEHEVTRVYAKDGTYSLQHDYPDDAEFCQSEVTAVTGDPLRPTSQSFDGCGMYERPRTLTYTRDAHGRVVQIGIDSGSDGTIEARVAVGYGCWSGSVGRQDRAGAADRAVDANERGR